MQDIVIAHPLMDDWVWVSDQFKDNLTRHVQLGNDNRKLAVLNFTYPQTMLEQVVRRAEERSLKVRFAAVQTTSQWKKIICSAFLFLERALAGIVNDRFWDLQCSLTAEFVSRSKTVQIFLKICSKKRDRVGGNWILFTSMAVTFGVVQINIFTASLNKTTTLFFNGDTRHHDITYSRGVRQTVYALFKDYPG